MNMPTVSQHERRVIRQCDDWLTQGPRNAWLSIHPLSVYMRKSYYNYDNRRFTGAILVGNVSVSPAQEGKGYMSSLLRWLESLKGESFMDTFLGTQEVDCVVFENCIGVKLVQILQNRPGWQSYTPPMSTFLQFIRVIKPAG